MVPSKPLQKPSALAKTYPLVLTALGGQEQGVLVIPSCFQY